MSEVIQKNNPSGNETAATIYYATWCPFCKKLIENLDRTETPYSLIDIDQSEEAGQWVEVPQQVRIHDPAVLRP